MDVKEKRIITILISEGAGLFAFFPLVLVGLAGPAPDDAFSISFKWIATIPNWLTITIIDLITCSLPGNWISDWQVLILLFFTQIIVYGTLGWIIARLIYPNKKTSNKAETPQD